MQPFIQRYGEEKTRNTIIAALYIATGKYGNNFFSAAQIKDEALWYIRSQGEEGTISTEMVNRVLGSVNGTIENNRGRYRVTGEIKIKPCVF